MAEDKTLLKKDLALVLKIDTRLHYDNILEVKQVYQNLITKKMFQTSIGQRYLKKLESIIQGNNTDTCIFCNKSSSKQSVICPECLTKMQSLIGSTPKPEPAPASTSTIKANATTPNEAAQQNETNTPPKKKKKRILLIAAVIFFILAGIGGLMSDTNMSSADFAQDEVDVETFLEQYEETMIREANKLSDEEFTVEFILGGIAENRHTYQTIVLDVSCGNIQIVCDENDNVLTICGYSPRNDSIGALLMITLVQTIHPDLSSEEAEALIAASTFNNLNEAYYIYGDYAYGYYHDADGLMLVITTKDNYNKSIK